MCKQPLTTCSLAYPPPTLGGERGAADWAFGLFDRGGNRDSSRRIPEIKVVIAESSYTSFVDNLPSITKLLKSRLPTYPSLVLCFSERQTGVPLREIRPIDDLVQLEGRPIMFIHGTSDEIVDVSHSQRLFEAAKEPKALYLVPDATHENIYAINRAEFEKQVISFLTQHFHAQ